METKTCIKERRSIRRFQPEKPDVKVIEEIVAHAAYAPSWKNTQITRYTYVQDDQIKAQIAATTMEFNAATMNSAPALVVVSVVKERSGYERDGSFTTNKGTGWQMFDAGAAAQTFCLAAKEEGLGTVIMGIFDFEKVAELLQVPENQEVVAVISIGYPAETPAAPKRKSVEDLLRIV